MFYNLMMGQIENEGLNIPPGPWAIRRAARDVYEITLNKASELVVRKDGASVVLPNGEVLRVPPEVACVVVNDVDPLLGTGTSKK